MLLLAAAVVGLLVVGFVIVYLVLAPKQPISGIYNIYAGPKEQAAILWADANGIHASTVNPNNESTKWKIATKDKQFSVQHVSTGLFLSAGTGSAGNPWPIMILSTVATLFTTIPNGEQVSVSYKVGPTPWYWRLGGGGLSTAATTEVDPWRFKYNFKLL